MQTIISPACKGDIPTIRALADIVFRRTYEPILRPGQVEYMLDWMYGEDSLSFQMDDGHRFFLAFADGGKPVGYMSVQRQEGEGEGDGTALLHLQKLYVLPGYQGLGIGGKLFRKAASLAMELSPCRMELNVNRGNPAVEFYRKQGMRVLREGDFPIGQGFYMNDYIMGMDF